MHVKGVLFVWERGQDLKYYTDDKYLSQSTDINISFGYKKKRQWSKGTLTLCSFLLCSTSQVSARTRAVQKLSVGNSNSAISDTFAQRCDMRTSMASQRSLPEILWKSKAELYITFFYQVVRGLTTVPYLKHLYTQFYSRHRTLCGASSVKWTIFYP